MPSVFVLCCLSLALCVQWATACASRLTRKNAHARSSLTVRHALCGASQHLTVSLSLSLSLCAAVLQGGGRVASDAVCEPAERQATARVRAMHALMAQRTRSGAQRTVRTDLTCAPPASLSVCRPLCLSALLCAVSRGTSSLGDTNGVCSQQHCPPVRLSACLPAVYAAGGLPILLTDSPSALCAAPVPVPVPVPVLLWLSASYLFKKGEKAGDLYVVMEGEVDLAVGRGLLCSTQRGDILGVYAVDNGIITANAIAKTPYERLRQTQRRTHNALSVW
jgi:hypothetical protein